MLDPPMPAYSLTLTHYEGKLEISEQPAKISVAVISLADSNIEWDVRSFNFSSIVLTYRPK